PLLGEPGERVREEGEDVELQGNDRRSRLAGLREALRDQDSARIEVYLLDTGAAERQQQARVQREHVVRRPGDDRGDASEGPAALLHHREPDQLELVVLV